MIPFDEKLILKQLVNNKEYFLKVIPFLDDSLFSEKVTKLLFKCVNLYNENYNRQPSFSVIDMFINNVSNVTDDQHTIMLEMSRYFKESETIDDQWLQDQTLEWIKQRKYYNAIIDGADKLDKGKLDTELPDKLNEAFSVTFDNTVGMEFTEYESRWNEYTKEETRIPFSLNILNSITRGGITSATLNCLMSSDTGGFKSGTMCSLASDYLREGKNVLYVSMEMGEKEVLERIDANMLDTEIDNIVKNGRETYISKMRDLETKTNGRFIVKQFPTSQAHVGHIRYLLRELKLKRKFVPDIIMVDYINIMASIRLKSSDAGNSYGYIKAISEELRGLAIEFGIPIWTATQSNRGGASNEELSITDISESYGLSYSLDLMIGIITTPEFDEQHKILFVQLKNRYSDKNINNKFFLGVNKAKMKLFETGSNNFTANGSLEEDESENNEFMNNIKKRKKSISL